MVDVNQRRNQRHFNNSAATAGRVNPANGHAALSNAAVAAAAEVDGTVLLEPSQWTIAVECLHLHAPARHGQSPAVAAIAGTFSLWFLASQLHICTLTPWRPFKCE